VTKKRPNILYLVHRVPYPPNRGDRIRSFHILKLLAKRADVHLATLADEPLSSETMHALRMRCRQVAIENLGKTRWLRGAVSLARGRSATEGLFRSRRLYHTVRNWANQTKFDAVVLYCSSMLQYLGIPALRAVPSIIDFVDVDSQKWFDYAARARGLKRPLFRLEGVRTRQLEAAACRRASFVALTSDAEAALFRRVCPNDHTYGIVNGVDLEYFRFRECEGRRGRCIFVGALDYWPNVDGLHWFCREIWPHVRSKHPGATFAIVGRNPCAQINRLKSADGVEVFPSVADVRPYLAEASIAVAPLRVARGIQNKVLEAMASGRAMIASREALEGLSVVAGEHVIEANSPQQWTAEILRLFDEDHERARLARAGRAFTVEHHNWENCLEPFDRLLLSIVPTVYHEDWTRQTSRGAAANPADMPEAILSTQ
jgi:sugar transferase (PEP-CTERM/EpsH1 system associated)